ncbi:MAG: glycosyltransferase family 2 protein [Nostoc sp.]|uniref:glycosyltransferase family 2 protein n=1 Tax=unclassified Nostoc TaxID=2593658 RepID=UPI0025E4238D|nr:glycosyltransferase family 2 protein [Nostoc sp. NMS9]MBN3940369.1 glycosyltransferase [Nostoc sp. NMS9]
MPHLPRFSIVTPSYNQAAFIGETIESVISQAGEFEIEYFVMDGGSSDGSIEVIKKYADLVSAEKWTVQCRGISIKWYSQKDKGQSDAINQGLRQATGDIVSYINSDDLYCPGAFERIAKEFSDRPEADFIYGDGDVIDEVGNLQWEWLSRPYNHSLMTSYHFLWNDFTNYIMQQATFWRKSVINKIGYFDESFHYAMDVEYWVRAGDAGLKLIHRPYKVGKFRLIKGTKSLSSPTVFWEDYLEIFRRYRGSQSLSIFFAYYYYNLAKEVDFDIQLTLEEGNRVFRRWKFLPDREKKIIEQQASRGRDLACLLLANELHKKQLNDLATATFKKGLSKRPLGVMHIFALSYIFKKILGMHISRFLDNVTQNIIKWYRWKRFQYRYHQRKL